MSVASLPDRRGRRYAKLPGVPKVSILVPSYGHVEFLPACLASAIDQTFTDWELVLVDDVSPDDSLAMAQTIAAQDTRLRVHRNASNLGTYGTLARALELSRGELVAVLNSDDRWASEKLRRQVDALEAHPEASACYVLGDDPQQHADWPTDPLQEPWPQLLGENRILASGVLFRREGLRFDRSLRYSGDWVALLEALSRGPFVCIAEPLTHWRKHEGQAHRRSNAQMAEEVRVRRAIRDGEWPAKPAANAPHLMALDAWFGEHADIWRTALRHGAWKRALAARFARTRLWPDAPSPAPELEIEPLSFQLGRPPRTAATDSPRSGPEADG